MESTRTSGWLGRRLSANCEPEMSGITASMTSTAIGPAHALVKDRTRSSASRSMGLTSPSAIRMIP
jgi:hypothetical protein